MTVRSNTPSRTAAFIRSPRGAAGPGKSSTAGAQQEAAVENASFDDLCNHGDRWTWSNWHVKVSRCMLYVIKQTYLCWMALRPLPTNQLVLSFRAMIYEAGEPNCNNDYLAAKFTEELMPARARLLKSNSPVARLGRAIMELPLLGCPGSVRSVDARTQWVDDSVRAAIRDGIKQVVIIAAGYDSRAYRLAQPGVRFFEVDLPYASKRKQELVNKLLPASKYPRPEYVSADLSKVKLADALATTSFKTQEPALFTIEGLVYYLPAAALQHLLSGVKSVSAPKSRITMDFLHLSSLSGRVWHPGFDTLWLAVYNKGERMYSGIDERPAAVEALLRKFGFRTHALLTGRDLAQRYMPHAEYRTTPGASVFPYYGFLTAERVSAVWTLQGLELDGLQVLASSKLI